MKDKETQQLIISILEFARDTKPSEFRLLRTWQDYKLYKNKRTAYKLLVRGLNRTSNRLFKKYCTGVSIGEGNINQLLAYQQLQTTLRFYEHEIVCCFLFVFVFYSCSLLLKRSIIASTNAAEAAQSLRQVL